MKIILLDKAACGDDLSYDGLSAFGKVYDLGVVNSEKEMLEIASKAEYKDAEVLLCNKAPVTADFLRRMPGLRYIGIFATGFNNVNMPEARAKGVTVCNVPGYSTEAVVQMTFALILQIASSVGRYNDDCEKGKWVGYPVFSMLTHEMEELQGKTLGVFGYGSIGRRVAQVGEAFGMKIKVCTRTERPGCPYLYVTPDELLGSADYLSLNAPLNEGTKLFINADSLKKMKDGAVIINTARGGLVDEQAVAEALQSGKLRAYGADVLTKEPMSPDCPLLGLHNCYLTPHVAWAHRETRARLLRIVEDNLRAYVNGCPQNRVN